MVLPGAAPMTRPSTTALSSPSRLALGRRRRDVHDRAAVRQVRAELEAAGPDSRIRRQFSLLAAEKITRKSLTGADQQRLIDEALAEIDFSALEGSRS